MNRTIVLTGARGGQGTSTVAAALALLAAEHGPTIICSEDPTTTAALIGIPLALDEECVSVRPGLAIAPLSGEVLEHVDDDVTLVVDAGRTPYGPFDHPNAGLCDLLRATRQSCERYVVLRGPCWVALNTAIVRCRPCDGVILLLEQGRALTSTDVADYLGTPVVAMLPVEAPIARSVDAGLLAQNLHRHHAVAGPLRRLVRPPTTLPQAPHQTDTDLPLSRGDRSKAIPGCHVPAIRRPVWAAWNATQATTADAEHRASLPRRCRVLRRRDRHLGRGLLHRPR